jgi:hypothetical protein
VLKAQRRHDDPSRLAPLEDRLAMLLKGVQARLQSMKLEAAQSVSCPA